MKEIYEITFTLEGQTMKVACNPGEIETIAKGIASGMAREIVYTNLRTGKYKNAWPECWDNSEPMSAAHVYREV